MILISNFLTQFTEVMFQLRIKTVMLAD